MQFKKLHINNFRNFEKVSIDIQNQNVVFGMNDMGKTNLLTALRFLLEREVRNQGFSETDFFQIDTSKEIKLLLEIDLSNSSSEDTQLLIAKIQGARTSREDDLFYIQLTSLYDGSEYYGIPLLKWGSDLDNLIEVPQRGSFTDLDSIFKVVYIDPSIDLKTIFDKNRRSFFGDINLSEKDQERTNEIKKISSDLNKKVSEMDIIADFQQNLTNEYKRFRNEEVNVELKSELEIKGYFNDLIPYIKRPTDDNYYSTSGDGRKKLLAYSLVNHIIRENEKNKIIIFLIEEPENNLHRTMQIALSKQLFTDSIYQYFFLSTHSEEMLYEMDRTTLIRVYSTDQPICNSFIFNVPEEYKKHKKELNRSLATGLFANNVLLVEGPSEQILFEKVLSVENPNYEIDGSYILNVNGIKFKEYYNVLKELGINIIVKTDNDLKAKSNNKYVFDLIGLNRGLELLGMEKENSVEINYGESERVECIKNKKVEIFQEKQDLIMKLNSNDIYISEVDLEHDLDIALDYSLNNILDKENGVKYLQTSKMIKMNELTKILTDSHCKKIYNHTLFQVLQELK